MSVTSGSDVATIRYCHVHVILNDFCNSFLSRTYDTAVFPSKGVIGSLFKLSQAQSTRLDLYLSALAEANVRRF